METFSNGFEVQNSEQGRAIGYVVEARTTYHEPTRVGDEVLTQNWRQLHFREAPVGVPNDLAVMFPAARQAGLYNYEAAQALAWWFHAEASLSGTACVETRLVKVALHYEWRCEEIGVGEWLSPLAAERSLQWTPRKPKAEDKVEASDA